MRNASSIRYEKKMNAKFHSIKIMDECASKCSKDHQEHPESEDEDEEGEDDEYHPDIENIIEKNMVYLHQWHRRLYELEHSEGVTKSRYRMCVDDETMQAKIIDVDPII